MGRVSLAAVEVAEVVVFLLLGPRALRRDESQVAVCFDVGRKGEWLCDVAVSPAS